MLVFSAALLSGIGLITSPRSTSASATTESSASKAFQVFEGKVCKGVRKQNRQVAKPLLRFNEIFYGGEQEPAELEAAGRAYRRVQDIWRSWTRRIWSIHAPAEVARLWRRSAREQDRVLKVGYQLVGALEAADLPRFEKRLKRYVQLQIKRNRTWTRIGLYCP
jgi:hypothetical protein